MKYRPEIDGLRALAVLPVILFHSGFEWFGGGFVGVDIFFVISGYLITLILIEDINNKRFSITSFYERRARRILPALFFVMIVCIPFAWMWMLPDALENFGQSLVSTSLFSNNFLLMQTAGYWDLASEYKPLLHTWSLAVEEQYYILFPIFLMLAWPFGKKKVFWLVLFIAVFSFIFSEFGWRKGSYSHFYNPISRVWELLAGSIAAFVIFQKKIQNNNGLALIGLIAILYSIFRFNEKMTFPSALTLIPVLGSVLIIIFADHRTFTAKILSTRALVSIGLISYSLYLWHQPILAFARIYKQDPYSELDAFVFLFLSIFLSFLTWKYVETPFRVKSYLSSLRVLSISAFMIIFFISIGLYFHISNGVPSRIFTNDAYQRSTHEFEVSDLLITAEYQNLEFQNDKHVLIVGDSFAYDIAYLFAHHKPSIKYTVESFEDPLESICKINLHEKTQYQEISSIMFVYDEGFKIPCINQIIKSLERKQIKAVFIGTKQFGNNMNWLARLRSNERISLCQLPNASKLNIDLRDAELIPEKNYFAFFYTFSTSGCFPITNNNGELLSSDRQHFTIAGIEYFGEKFFKDINISHAIN